MATNRAAVRAAGAGFAADIEFDSDAFMASLQDAVSRLEIASEAALWTVGLQVQNHTRMLAPVDTGRLRASWKATKGNDLRGPFVEIGTNVFYAAYVEFGTRHMPAQPHVRPALAMAAGMLPGAIRAAAR